MRGFSSGEMVSVPVSLLRLPRRALMLLVFNTKWDAFLTIVPGILLLAFGVRQSKEANTEYYLYVATYDTHQWLKLIPLVAVVTGSTAVFLGVFRFAVITLKDKNSFRFYIGVHTGLVFLYVAVAISSNAAHDKVSTDLNDSMQRQLVLLHRQSSMFSTALQENWDQLQMKMRCCGVDNYRDYSALSEIQRSQSSVPNSCCVLKGSNILEPENVAQCQADARMNVRDSIFIFAQGCYEPLLNWVSRYVLTPQKIFMGAIFSQILAAAQGLWVFMSSVPTRKTAVLSVLFGIVCVNDNEMRP